MATSFYQHINKFARVSQKDFEKILSFFERKTAKKKTLIADNGQKCNDNYFVLKGCLQMFFIDKQGSQRTLHLAIENWWITDEQAYTNRTISDCSIQAVENTEYLSISYKKQEELLDAFPVMERYFRMVYQISYGASHRKMRYLFDYSKEDIYLNFIEQFPEFAQRVPQYLIASYLGLSPEYVSKIRRKKRS